MKLRSPLVQVIIFIFFLFIQSIFIAYLPKINIFFPDIAFCMFIFFAFDNGNKYGFWTGFIAGLIMHPFLLPDVVLGLYPFIYTLIGYIAGNLKGKLIIDPLLLPILYTILFLFIKFFLLFLFSFLPDIPISFGSISNFLIHTGTTLFISPLIYNILRWIGMIDLNERTND